MKTHIYSKASCVAVVLLFMTTALFSQVITGPTSVCGGSSGNVYVAPPGMQAYTWSITGGSIITSGVGTNSITVTWTDAGSWVVSVGYTDPLPTPHSVAIILTVNVIAPTITGPTDPITFMPVPIGAGITNATYSTEPGMNSYIWSVSTAGTISSGGSPEIINVTWTNPTGQQSVQVTYTDPGSGCTSSASLIVNYYPFAAAIDPTVTPIPQFVDPLPHFAAGLRVNAKAGGNLIVKALEVQQVALSTGTVLANGTVGDPLTPNAGKGNYAGYAISKDNGVTFTPAMWPGFTIEAQQGFPLTVQYQNDLFGVTYDHFNILADQTLMMHGYTLNGNPKIDPYLGPIPMVAHLHGGEIPSNSDGGPNAWFMPGYSLFGPAFQFEASSMCSYPNMQEATTLWFHPHDDGLTRTNVFTGLAAYYFLRGANEEQAHLPGWTQDDLVREVTPPNCTPTFNGSNVYLPEIEIAIQDRMFNVNGELYWPVNPTNPDLHPYWTPEFIGDIMTVNGKTWPYLSVAPRKYRFRLLEGCNARMVNIWLADANGNPGPAINVIGAEGGLLDAPQALNPALGQTLLFAPGERYDVVIDFSGYPAGTTFIMMNNANAPYPGGDPVIPGITDRIMAFVVNGEMISAADKTSQGTDNSLLPQNLRPVTAMTKFTDFAGNIILPNGMAKPDVKRQILLNEVTGAGGPATVQVNNTYFESELAIAPSPYAAGGPTELQREGTIEMVQIINTTADAHPIHIHLLQWQLVSRQSFDGVGYMNAYAAAWLPKGIPEFPAGLGYPGGAGTPFPYDQVNADGAIGGNPAVSPFLNGPVLPANPEERSFKDNIIALPGYVSTFMVRVSPTEKPLNATPEELLFPFDPSLGPGYVVHCHIIDHEDMSMMRPLMILPSFERYPKITQQPAPVVACAGDAISYSVIATSKTTISYQWQLSTDGGTSWSNLTNGTPYSGVLTETLGVKPAVPPISSYLYRCVLTNIDGTTISNAASLTVTVCKMRGRLRYSNDALDALAGFTVSVNGLTTTTGTDGSFEITGVTSGTFPVIITTSMVPGAINSTDAGALAGWVAAPVNIPHVSLLAADVDNNLIINNTLDVPLIQQNFVKGKAFLRSPWSFWEANVMGMLCPSPLTVTVSGTDVNGFEIHGMVTGDFNGSFNPNNPAGSSNVTLTASGETIIVAAGKQFDLPIEAANAMPQVGAISLVLNIPSNLVTVKNVKVPGGNGPVTYNVKGNELRIGWNSTIPVNVVAGGPVVTLTLGPTKSFTSAQTFAIGLVSSGLNEIADGAFNPIANAGIQVDNVQVTNTPIAITGGLKLDAYPDPATTSTTVTYQLPSDGTVSLGFTTSSGISFLQLVNEYQLAGNYSIPVNVSTWSTGTYYLTLKLTSGTKVLTKTLKFVKQ